MCNVIFNLLSSDNLSQQKVEDSSQETSDKAKEQAKDPVKKEVKEEHAEQMAAEETEKRVQWRKLFLFLFNNWTMSANFLRADSQRGAAELTITCRIGGQVV